jgi:hypothetical protein
MQTGPALHQSMDRWLLWTGGAEILNVGIFLFLFRQLGHAFPPLTGPMAMIGFATLSIILVEGGLYWWGKRLRLSHHLSTHLQRSLLKAMYVTNGILLLVFPAVLVGSLVTDTVSFHVGDIIFGLVWYLFGVGEFIHYFIWKINMRSAERTQQRKTGRRIPARFRRELLRLQRSRVKT